jgi:predicted metal-dependent phosphoesterase TrpH
MREYGIDGIECWHPSADDVQAEALREYAVKHGLVMTRGSDFHSDYLNRDFSRYHRP